MTLSKFHTREELETIANYGVDAVSFWQWEATDEWAECFAYTRLLGMKVVPVWPNWIGLGLCTEAHAFRTAAGDISSQEYTDVEGQWGPSYWHPEATDIALETLPGLVGMGIDGVIISPREGDNYFPINWNDCNAHSYCGTRQYWSFDAWAVASWNEYSDGQPMPELADNQTNDNEFYQWYRAGYSNRLNALTAAVVPHNIDTGAWLVPMEHDMAETRTAGTAHSFQSVHEWQLNTPRSFLVAACVFPYWPNIKSSGINFIRRGCGLGWDVMVGAEAYGSPQIAADNISQHGQFLHSIGVSGMVMSPSQMFPSSDVIMEAIGSLPCTNEPG